MPKKNYTELIHKHCHGMTCDQKRDVLKRASFYHGRETKSWITDINNLRRTIIEVESGSQFNNRATPEWQIEMTYRNLRKLKNEK